MSARLTLQVGRLGKLGIANAPGSSCNHKLSLNHRNFTRDSSASGVLGAVPGVTLHPANSGNGYGQYAVAFLNKWTEQRARTLASFSAQYPRRPGSRPRNGNSTKQNENGNGEFRPANVEDFVLQMSTYLRRKQRMKREDMLAVVEMVEKGASIGDHGAYLLTAIASYLPDMLPDERIKLCKILWQAIEKEGKLSVESFEALLKCYTDCEYTDYKPLEFLMKLENSLLSMPVDGRIMKPSEKTYFYLLLSYCQAGDMKCAIKVLDLIKCQNIVVNEDHFHALMLGNCRAKDQKSAVNILDIMKVSNLEPTPKTYATLMQIHMENNNSTELQSVYRSAGGVEFSEATLFKLIRIAVLRKDEIALNTLLKWVPKFQQNNVSATYCIVNLIHSGFPKEAAAILMKCKSGLNVPGVQFGGFLIKELVMANCNFDLILDICRQIEGTGLNDIATSMAAEFSLRYHNFSLSHRLFEVLRERQFPLRPHYFWPILLHEANANGVQGIVKTINTMQKFKVAPDWDTLTDFVLPRMFSHMSDAYEVAKILKDSGGISYSSGLLKVLLFYLLRRGQLSDAAQLSRKIRGTISQPGRIIDQLLHCVLQVDSREEINQRIEDAVPILKLVHMEHASDDKYDHVGKFVVRLHEAVGYGSKSLTEFLVRKLEKADVQISEAAKDTIETFGIKCNLKIDPDLTFVSFSRSYLHPKEMDAASLESHVVELKGKDFNPRGSQRLLFVKYCQTNDATKVESLKSEFESSYGELSTGMTSSLLGFYLRQKNLEKALDTFTKLKAKIRTTPLDDEYFQIDLNKVTDLTTLLVENNRIEEGIAFLQKESLSVARKDSEDSRGYTRTVYSLLEALHRKGTRNLKEVLQYLLDADLIQPSAPVNGVVIKHFIERSELTSAVETFEEYSLKYKITPMLVQLLYSLLPKENEHLLQRVIATCVKSRGAHETKHFLAFAMSDTGDINGAARIFKELGRNKNSRRIENQCDYLAERSEVKKVINLIESLIVSSASDMEKAPYDCSRLYLSALNCCERTGDPQSLDAVLQLIQESDERKTSSTFIPTHILKLANELKVKMRAAGKSVNSHANAS